MVKIERAGHTLTVTRGAFNTLYRPLGYVIVGTEGEPEASPISDEAITPPVDDAGSEDDQGSIEDEDNEADEEQDDEEEDLDEKPLSEMNFKELKAYAKRRGINTNGMSSKKEVREAILEAEEEE